MRAYALYFNSSDVVDLVPGELKDGYLTVGDKTFYVGDKDSESLKIKTSFGGVKPLYIVHHKSIYPVKMTKKLTKTKHGGKTIDGIVTQLVVEKDRKFTPDALFKSLNLKILGGMLKINTSNNMIGAFIGVVIGAVVTAIVMYVMKVV